MASKLSRRLSAQDAAFLYYERKTAPLHIGSLGVYEGSIPFDRFHAHVESRMPNIPRYRQRLAFVPLSIAHPTWEDDADFSVSNHVKRVSLPAPGNDQQLAELSAELFAQPLTREKPLWEMFVIEGLEGGRTGILSKVHHCMVDGVAGIELLVAILDISPEPAPAPEQTPWDPSALPDTGARLAEAFSDQVSQQRGLLQELQEGLTDPGRQMRRSQDILHALSLASQTAAPPPRPFAARIGPERVVAFSEMSFVEVREIRTSLGGKVNDVVLSILSGAFHRYLTAHDTSPEPAELRVAIPVNIRLEEEQSMGNHVSCMVAALPIGEFGAAERLSLVRERLDYLKQENQAGGLELLSRLAALTPPAAQAFAALAPGPNTLVDLICTNLPGPMIPLYSVGHLMLAHYPLVPLSFDMGLGVGITSYNQRLYVGLVANPAVVPDIDLLKRCVDESFLELRNAAGVDDADVPAIEDRRNGQSAAAQPALAESSATT